MRFAFIVGVIATSALAASAYAQSSDRTLDYLDTMIRNIGYTPELPPTTLPVNSLYRRMTDSSQVKFYRTRCPSVFAGPTVEGKSQIGEYSFSQGWQAGFSAKFLPELKAKAGVDLDVTMKAQDVTKVGIKFGVSTTREAPGGALTKECETRLKEVAQGGKLGTENRLIMRTLSTNSLTYTFELKGDFEIVVKAVVAKLVEAGGNLKVTPNSTERKIIITPADGALFTIGLNALPISTIDDVRSAQ